MLTIPYSRFSVRSSLAPEELVERLQGITRRRHWRVWSQADARFAGHIRTTGFSLVYVPRGRNTYAPWLRGEIRARSDGSELAVRMTLHPLTIAIVVGFACAPQYLALQAGGFSFVWLAAILAFHVLMYHIGFVPDALQAESLIREVAALSRVPRNGAIASSQG